MPDYTTDERWRRGPRKHTARRWYNAAKGGLVLRCDGCDYEPVEGTAREQEDAHRAHRVVMGENVKAQRVLPRGVRLKQAEGERDRYRSAWQSARLRAEGSHLAAVANAEACDNARDQGNQLYARIAALAADMRTWCSPHGLADHYADQLDRAIAGPEPTPKES